MRHLAGTGGCGRVYLAENAAGEKLAVKVFDGLAIQRGLLAKMTGRLSESNWPPGALPILTADYESRPAFQITPWLADGEPGEGALPVPRTLQNRLGDFPGEASWPVIHALAAALAALHERRVAHGNLKPGNVFFSDTGELLVADWALGNMPGVGRFEFTDAVLYQPPEQLLDPRGYADESGYRWDVFAFGVLAFRLLTGKFPRCHETFASVAPAPGESLRDGIHADLPRIASGLEASPEVTWPTEPSDATEAGFRTCLDRCLALDPRERPATLLEVVAEFGMVTAEVAKAREREHLLDLRRRAERRARRALLTVGALALVVLILGFAWQSSYAELRLERQQRGEERLAMAKEIAQEVEMRKAADQDIAAKQEASNQAAKRLVESRRIGDQLFSWAMDKGHRQLPPLDGREPRLNQLKRYFEDFLTRTAGAAELADERAHAKHSI